MKTFVLSNDSGNIISVITTTDEILEKSIANIYIDATIFNKAEELSLTPHYFKVINGEIVEKTKEEKIKVDANL